MNEPPHDDHDIQSEYRWRRMTLSPGAYKLAVNRPPQVTSRNDMNTPDFTEDTVGRYPYSWQALRLPV